MTTYNITLPDDVAEIVKEKAAAGGYESATDYLQALIAQMLDQQARVRLETMLIEGLESGPPIEVRPEFWERKKQELLREYHDARPWFRVRNSESTACGPSGLASIAI